MKKTHEQFLEDLWNRNKHYREGKFKVVGQYEKTEYRIELETKFGRCMCVPHVLLRDTLPDIRSATSKSEYFKNVCLEKFGNDDINDLSEVEYVCSNTKVKVTDRDYGEYFITPSDYLSGRRNSKRGRETKAKRERMSIQSAESKIKKLHPELTFTLNEYTSRRMHINVTNKYGLCKMTIDNLLLGAKPTIKSAINKNEYFANQAREVHGNKYDYSLVEYKNCNKKIKIIGEYGTFEQRPSDHLQGSGSLVESKITISDYQKSNPTGWAYTNWEAAAKRSKKFTGYKVYFIECQDLESEEKFYKIGRTYIDVKNRFCGKKLPYTYIIIKVVETDSAKEACELEQELKNKHKEFKYIPSKKFNGMYECFHSLNIDLQTN